VSVAGMIAGSSVNALIKIGPGTTRAAAGIFKETFSFPLQDVVMHPKKLISATKTKIEANTLFIITYFYLL
jgi:hypothetical protein